MIRRCWNRAKTTKAVLLCKLKSKRHQIRTVINRLSWYCFRLPIQHRVPLINFQWYSQFCVSGSVLKTQKINSTKFCKWHMRDLSVKSTATSITEPGWDRSAQVRAEATLRWNCDRMLASLPRQLRHFSLDFRHSFDYLRWLFSPSLAST